MIGAMWQVGHVMMMNCGERGFLCLDKDLLINMPARSLSNSIHFFLAFIHPFDLSSLSVSHLFFF